MISNSEMIMVDKSKKSNSSQLIMKFIFTKQIIKIKLKYFANFILINISIISIYIYIYIYCVCV